MVFVSESLTFVHCLLSSLPSVSGMMLHDSSLIQIQNSLYYILNNVWPAGKIAKTNENKKIKFYMMSCSCPSTRCKQHHLYFS